MQNVIAPQEVHIDSLHTLNSLFNKSRGLLQGIFFFLSFPLSFLSTTHSAGEIFSVWLLMQLPSAANQSLSELTFNAAVVGS